MMQACGILFLSKTPPTATVAADGVFGLTMLAYDRLGPHRVEPWRLIFTGPVAKEFWADHKASLTPGRPLYAELEHIRCVKLDAPRVPEFQAMVMHMALAPTAQEIQQQQNDREPSQNVRESLSS